MKVFILEDDPLRMTVLRRLLPTADITHVVSCVEADQFQPPYDLILLDHDLGGRQMDEHEDCGLTFVRMVNRRFDSDTPIVIHSFNPDGANAMAHVLRDCNVYLAPFGFAMFKRILLQLSEDVAA